MSNKWKTLLIREKKDKNRLVVGKRLMNLGDLRTFIISSTIKPHLL